MTLSDYYQTILNMSKEHHYSLSDLDNMIPYEIDLFVALMSNKNTENEEERHAKLMRSAGL